jgi:hypothetical protein
MHRGRAGLAGRSVDRVVARVGVRWALAWVLVRRVSGGRVGFLTLQALRPAVSLWRAARDGRDGWALAVACGGRPGSEGVDGSVVGGLAPAGRAVGSRCMAMRPGDFGPAGGPGAASFGDWAQRVPHKPAGRAARSRCDGRVLPGGGRWRGVASAGGAVDWLPGDGRFHVVRHCVGTPALCLKGVVGAGRGSCRRGCGSDRWASPPGRARAQVWRGRGSRWRGDGGWRRGGGRTYSAGSGSGSAAVRRRRTSRL